MLSVANALLCRLTILALLLVAPRLFAQQPAPPEEAGLKVLILGDSLALCGFGKRLDERFRESPLTKATVTYLACGTNPLSWLKERPYTNVKTNCGYVSIESIGNGLVKQVEDVWGMRRGHSPGSHPVPKLEDLLVTFQPDILVMQTGTNLFELFADRKTVIPNRHGPALRTYLAPFISKAVKSPSPLRKIYWVASPTSGRVSKEVQDFVLQQTRADIGHAAHVIDSRTLVAYPYRHMEPDKEHFLGEEMDQWADGVFEIVKRDLSAQPIASLRPLSEAGTTEPNSSPPTVSQPTANQPAVSPPPANQPTVNQPPVNEPTVNQPQPPAEKPRGKKLHVRAKLISKTAPVPVEEFLPYREFLVGYLYEITRVIAGEYSESQILVMHPAYIGLRPQKLRYKIGKNYRMQLHELEGTVWKTVKSKDDSGLINLLPYIRIQDEKKHPDYAR